MPSSRQEQLRKAGISVSARGYARKTSLTGTFTKPNQEYHYHSHQGLNEEESEMANKIREALRKKQKKAAIKYFWHTAEVLQSNPSINRGDDSPTQGRKTLDNAESSRKETTIAEDEEDDELDSKAPVANVSDVFSFLESAQTKLLFFIGCVASIASGLVFPALAFLFSNSFSDLSTAQDDTTGINEMVVTFLYLGAAAFIASMVQNALLEITASRAARSFSLRWFEALLRQDTAFFDVYDISSFASNITSNAQKIKVGLGRKFGEGIQFFTCTVGGLAYAFYSSWRVSLIIIFMLPFVAMSAVAVMKFNQGRTAFSQRAYASAGGVAYQTVSSIKTVLSLNAIPEMIRQYQNATAGAFRYAVTPLWKEGIANGCMLGSFIFLYLVLTVYGSRLIYIDVRQTGCDPSEAVEGNASCQNTGVDVFAAMLGVAFAGQGMSQIAAFMEAFGNARAAAFPAMTAILRSLDNDPEEQILIVNTNKDGEVVLTDATDEVNKDDPEEGMSNSASNREDGLKKYALPMYEIDSSSSKGSKHKITGRISFQNVCFSYPTRPNQPVLDDFCLDIEAGTTVAIVGPSGGGKSTTVSLIERFYDPNWGRILLDGTDLKKFNVPYLRHHIGLVGQEPVLFADTISNNIASGMPGVSQEKIEKAARMANAHDFIRSFPKGYKTQVGDKGAQLSGGQKQRIAIARILLKNPEILLLDEATSALDTESELVVQEAIDKLLTKERRTTVIIAHRLTTIRKADVIVFLKDGQVAEMGTHEELMDSDLGLYRYLVEKQLMIKREESASSMERESSAGGLSSMNNSLSAFSEEKKDEEDTEKGPVTNVIKFKNVKFSYPSRPEKIILNDFNLSVRKGETMALVGPSGGGKSTTVGLIERFYDPNDGMIRFENKKVTKVNVGWLRHQIGYVGQEPTLFNASIATNISYGSPGASKQDIVDAAILANAHDFISSFPDGYDTEVGERGTQISGGQKQRIAIARALVKKPKVLLLDEATSALDSASEHIVQEALDKLMASSEHTTIVIAHRLSTIRNVDRIAYISDGIVQELGSHDELMAKKHGRYLRLVKSQERSTTLTDETLKKVTSDDEEGNHEEDEKKNRKRRGTKNSNEDEDASFDPKWARNMAKQDINYFIVGAFGIILAGAVFPAWGIMFGLMIKTLFFPVFPCTTEDIDLGVPPWFDCDELPLPGCFNECDAYWQSVSKKIESESFVLAGYWALVIICCLVGNTLSFIGFGTASERMNKRIRDSAFTALVRQEVAYFDTRTTGNITSALEDDAAKIHTFSGEPIRTFLLNVSSVAVGITVSFIYMWQFALLSLAVIPLMGFATAVEFKLMLGVSDENLEKDVLNSPGGIAVETLLNMKTVASLSLEKIRYDTYKKALESSDEEEIKMGLKTGFTRGLSIIIQQYVNALQFWWGGWLLSRYDNYTFDDFLIAMFALLFSLFALGAAAVNASDKDEATKAATRIYQLIHRESKNDPLANKKGTRKGSSLSTALETSQNISRRSTKLSSTRSKATVNSIL